MTLLAFVAIAWLSLALPFGVLLGRAMQIADRSGGIASVALSVPDFIPAHVLASVAAQDDRQP